MKTIDFSYFIERYNAGEMDQTEETWFKKELEGDESLQKEVLLRKKTDNILGQQDIITLRNKLASIENAKKDEMNKSGKFYVPRFRYAAVITGLIVIGSLLFFSFNKQSSETIFKKYYQTYNYTETSRSAGASFNRAIDYFNNKEFERALEGFQAFLKTNPGSSKIEFLSGISNMELRNYPDAEKSFDRVITRNDNLYIDDANWCLAMCYIITGNKSKAREQLSKIAKSESINKNNARKILRHL